MQSEFPFLDFATRQLDDAMVGCDITSTLPFRPDISFATSTGQIMCYRHGFSPPLDSRPATCGMSGFEIPTRNQTMAI